MRFALGLGLGLLAFISSAGFAEAPRGVRFLSPQRASERGLSFGRTLEWRARAVNTASSDEERDFALLRFKRGLEVVGIDVGFPQLFDPSPLLVTPERRQMQIDGNGRLLRKKWMAYVENKLEQMEQADATPFLLERHASRPILDSQFAYLKGLNAGMGGSAFALLQKLARKNDCVAKLSALRDSAI